MADNGQYQDEKGDLDVPTQPLSQDYDTPSAPPEEQDDIANKTHPATDDHLDETEVYNDGVSRAAEINTKHEER
jgi:hypothetical protein